MASTSRAVQAGKENKMKLIDKIAKETGDEKEYILETACPSSYGPEYDKYEDCDKTCEECWNQEVQD